MSEEQRRIVKPRVVESAFVEASETDDAGRTQTLQKEALDDDVLKAGIGIEGEYKSETLQPSAKSWSSKDRPGGRPGAL